MSKFNSLFNTMNLHQQLMPQKTEVGNLKPELQVLEVEAKKTPEVTASIFDKSLYINAYTRLGMLNIANIVDIGCGAGNFVSIMKERQQLAEMYLGIDKNHKDITMAKALYPDWNFMYGDYNEKRIKAECERYGAFLMLNFLDTIDDDLAFIESLPSKKPLVFSFASSSKEGVLRYAKENRDIYEMYSNYLSLKSIGKCNLSNGETVFVCTAVKW